MHSKHTRTRTRTRTRTQESKQPMQARVSLALVPVAAAAAATAGESDRRHAAVQSIVRIADRALEPRIFSNACTHTRNNGGSDE